MKISPTAAKALHYRNNKAMYTPADPKLRGIPELPVILDPLVAAPEAGLRRGLQAVPADGHRKRQEDRVAEDVVPLPRVQQRLRAEGPAGAARAQGG